MEVGVAMTSLPLRCATSLLEPDMGMKGCLRMPMKYANGSNGRSWVKVIILRM